MVTKKKSVKKKITKKSEEHIFYRLFATGFGAGNVGHPGMIGSLLALPIWLYATHVMRIYFDSEMLIYLSWGVLLTILFFIGATTADYVGQKMHNDDPPSVIIDEILGQLITLVLTQHIIINQAISHSNGDNLRFYGTYLVLNLVIFRLLDVFKPSLLGTINKKIKGHYAIMADDVLAGIMAAIFINILYIIF